MWICLKYENQIDWKISFLWTLLGQTALALGIWQLTSTIFFTVDLYTVLSMILIKGVNSTYSLIVLSDKIRLSHSLLGCHFLKSFRGAFFTRSAFIWNCLQPLSIWYLHSIISTQITIKSLNQIYPCVQNVVTSWYNLCQLFIAVNWTVILHLQ